MQGPFKNLMKQAQQMQAKLAEVQEELKGRHVEASSGGGMVTATASGAQEIVSLKIERDIVNPDDVDMLQDLIRAAVNESLKKAREMMAQEMGKVTGGMSIPGLIG
jgi:DNA-binding YbaB/EbfC family protein